MMILCLNRIVLVYYDRYMAIKMTCQVLRKHVTDDYEIHVLISSEL